MKGLLPCILIIVTPLLLSAEIQFGITAENNTTFLFQDEQEYDEYSNRALIKPFLQWNSETLEIKGEAELAWNSPGDRESISVRELYAQYYNYGLWKVQIGRFSYLPGSAEILSNTNYFSSMDYLRFIETMGGDAVSNGDMLQLTLSGSSSFIKGSFGITPSYIETPSEDSPWLPTNLLRENLYIYTVGFFTRQDIYTRDPLWPDIGIEDFTTNIEAGYSSYWFDLSLQFYKGWDNTPLNRVRYDMKEDNQFDLTVIPEYQKRTSVGVNTTANWNSLHFWFDGSYTFDKRIANRIYYIPDYKTSFTETPYLEGTAGLRYDFFWNDMSILLERKESRIYNSEEGIVTPYMNSAVAGAIQLYLKDYKHRPACVFLYHLEDESWMGALQWQYSPGDNFSMEGTLGMLEGDEDSLFGHYEQDWLVSLNLTYRR